MRYETQREAKGSVSFNVVIPPPVHGAASTPYNMGYFPEFQLPKACLQKSRQILKQSIMIAQAALSEPKQIQ